MSGGGGAAEPPGAASAPRRRIPWQAARGTGYRIETLDVDPAATALLLVDLQVAHLDPDQPTGRSLRREHPAVAEYYYGRVANTVLPAVDALLSAFRAAGRRIVFTRSVASAGEGGGAAPWSWRHAQVSQGRCRIPALLPPGDPGAALAAELGPRPGDLLLDKLTLSPFNGTALDGHLRNMRVENLVIGGVLTNGAVETTARGAADRGYHTVVVEDACAAFSPGDHDCGTRFPTWYVVKSVAEALRDLI